MHWIIDTRMRMALAPLAVGGCILVAAAAHAQSGTGRRINISPQIRTVYDTNVLRLPDGFVSERRRGDLRVTPQVRADISVPIGRQRAFLIGTAGYDFYRYNNQLERERIDLVGGADVRFSRCAATVSVGYQRAQSNIDDLLRAGGSTRNLTTSILPNAVVSCGRAGGGLTQTVAYSGQRVRNSSNTRSLGDFNSDAVTASVGLARPTLGDLSVYGSYSRGEYISRMIFGTGTNEQVTSYGAGLRLTRQFGQVRGFVSGGYVSVSSNAPGVRGYSGNSYGAALTWTPGTRLQVVGSAARDIQQNSLLNVSYGVVDSFDLAGTYALSSFVRLRAGAGYTKRDFADSTVVAGPRQVDDNTKDLRVGAVFTSPSGLGVDLDATYRDRRSDDPLFSYDTVILALTLRYR